MISKKLYDPKGYETWFWTVSWSLQVWYMIGCIWSSVKGRWLNPKLYQKELKRKILTLVWSRNWPWIFFLFFFFIGDKIDLGFEWERKCFLDLDMALYFRRVFVWFFSLSVSHFLIWEASIIGNSMVFDLQFFLNIYLELIIKFEFNLALHLIFSKKKKKTTFHMGLFLFLLM